MPIGKGYFWEGLSQGVRGLYGSMQNERMANDAQGAREREGALDRVGRLEQIQAAMGKPPTDTLNPDLDANNNALKASQAALKEHAGDIITKSQNPAGWALEHAALSETVRKNQEIVNGFQNKTAIRNGVNSVPAKAPSKKDAFMQSMFDRIK